MQPNHKPTTVITHFQERRSPAGLPVCSLRCTTVLHQQLNAPIAIGRTSGDYPWCTHCFECGRIIRIPEKCDLHGRGNCPANHWEHTLDGRIAIHEIATLTGKPVTGEQVAAAAEHHQRNPHLMPEEVADAVVRTG